MLFDCPIAFGVLAYWLGFGCIYRLYGLTPRVEEAYEARLRNIKATRPLHGALHVVSIAQRALRKRPASRSNAIRPRRRIHERLSSQSDRCRWLDAATLPSLPVVPSRPTKAAPKRPTEPRTAAHVFIDDRKRSPRVTSEPEAKGRLGASNSFVRFAGSYDGNGKGTNQDDKDRIQPNCRNS